MRVNRRVSTDGNVSETIFGYNGNGEYVVGLFARTIIRENGVFEQRCFVESDGCA